VGNRSPVASIMIVRDLKAFVFGSLNGQPNPLVDSKHRRAIMNLLLFVLEIFLVVAGIALVPARSELRVNRSRVTHDERKQENSPRSQRSGAKSVAANRDSQRSPGVA